MAGGKRAHVAIVVPVHGSEGNKAIQTGSNSSSQVFGITGSPAVFVKCSLTRMTLIGLPDPRLELRNLLVIQDGGR